MRIKKKRLKKDLGLLDVYCIATGAMFSSGFFLLPGLASAQAGPSVVLAYLIGGILVLPAMLSAAELSTAMPRAGGPYYFLDRSLGPMVGTIGGLGTWLALVFKVAFALIGMGAYLGLFVDVSIKPVAITLAVVFTLMNIVGIKKSSQLQVFLVIPLLLILVYFVVEGLLEVFQIGIGTVTETQFTPFMPFGVEGLLATTGLVFVSYAGLTQVASVSEEVRRPARDIPLGMILSLLTATVVYVLGVYVIVAVLESEALRGDLTPVATAALVFLDRLPGPTGLILVVIAAVVAFASTGNAGIMSAARYPFAMARDRLIWRPFELLGRGGTPVAAILGTSAVIIFFIVILDVEAIAKLASSFMLLIFGLLNLAVIIMRESKIGSYLPDFRSPMYPWMQIGGIVAAVVLIAGIGMLSILFTGGVVVGCILWYMFYAKEHVVREGAIYHLFARLGTQRYEGLDSELRGILKERVDQQNIFEEMVMRSPIMDLPGGTSPDELVRLASAELAKGIRYTADDLAQQFQDGNLLGATPVADGVALPHLSLPEVEEPQLVVVRLSNGLSAISASPATGESGGQRVHALFFVVSDQAKRGQHLRLLAQIASRIDEGHFLDEWLAARDEQELKETLLRHEHYVSLTLVPHAASAELMDRPLRDLRLPTGTLVAMVRRRGSVIVPRGKTVLQEGDRVTIIGEPDQIRSLFEKYHSGA